MSPNECNEDFWYAFMMSPVMGDLGADFAAFCGGGPLDRTESVVPHPQILAELEEECLLLEQACAQERRDELSGTAWHALEACRAGWDTAQRVRRALDDGWYVLDCVWRETKVSR